jgi:crotonobetainyl-CoA:carnitine CoA-transferase CaiB-like acyl-CoA transferase
MSLLRGLRVVQIGEGLAAAVCGRLFADVGADVSCVEPDISTPLAAYLNHSKSVVADDTAARCNPIAAADLIVCEGRPQELCALQYDSGTLRRINATAALVYISPFGQTGSKANDPATDLTLFFASGIARLLTGQVDDLAEPPIRPIGEQSAFVGGLASACAGMHAAMAAPGAMVDVAIVEALATLAITELARAGLTERTRPRKREADGNGATVTILPARDGYVAISPREERQWTAWLSVMGSPDWGSDPRFATKPDRVANWDALHGLMSASSRHYDKQWIADRAQAAHVPSFPLREPAEQLDSPQLAHRKFWRRIESRSRLSDPRLGCRSRPSATILRTGTPARCPSPAFGSSISAGSLPVRRRHAISRRWAPKSSRSRLRNAAIPPWLGAAHRSRPGEAQHCPRPEEAGSDCDRAGACCALRRRCRKFLHRRHVQARPRRGRPASPQP